MRPKIAWARGPRHRTRGRTSFSSRLGELSHRFDPRLLELFRIGFDDLPRIGSGPLPRFTLELGATLRRSSSGALTCLAKIHWARVSAPLLNVKKAS